MRRFGFVHAVDGAAVYWGTRAVDPSADDVVLEFESRAQGSAAGTFEFADGAGEHLYVALPQSFGQVEEFYFEGMPVVFEMTELTLLVSGALVEYYLYKSPEATAALDIELTVPA